MLPAPAGPSVVRGCVPLHNGAGRGAVTCMTSSGQGLNIMAVMDCAYACLRRLSTERVLAAGGSCLRLGKEGRGLCHVVVLLPQNPPPPPAPALPLD